MPGSPLGRTDTALSGDVGGRYRLGDLIGQGGMADVYAAEDLEYQRQVAVKFLRAGVSASISEERFRREISIAATLSHPHIVPLFDSGSWEGRLYYVMPRVEGRNLREELEVSGPLPLERTLRIVRDVGEALAHAHSRGVVHRDIKPANIILTDEYAVVSDFGVAKSWGVHPDLALTVDGLTVGTPLYMAPEQATDPDRVSPRSDTYSLGCVVYEMLTGAPPFPGSNVPGLIAEHLLKDPPSLHEVDPSIPDDVARAVARAIAKSPDRRYDSVADFVTQLEHGAAPRRTGAGIGAGRPAWVWLLGLAVVAIVSVIIGRGMGNDRGWVAERPPSVLVVAFADDASSREERDLAVALADDLTFELSWWDDIRVVPRIAQSGALHDLGLAGPVVSNLREAEALARSLEVSAAALVRVSLTAGGDSARVEYSLLRADDGPAGNPEPVGAPTVIQAGLEPLALIEPMARRLLGLEARSEPLVGRRVGTRSREAVRDFDDGMRALSQWRLLEAQRHFEEALAADSTFAMAHLRLGQTLYWQTLDDLGTRSASQGPVILRAAGAARRHARGGELPTRAVDHIEAFNAFVSGDYEGARAAYRRLLGEDPTDLFALALLGGVENDDPWLDDASPPRPRGDLNVALASFRRAVELNPDFEIGYGQLFAIYRRAGRAVGPSWCEGFERPRPESIAPTDERRPTDLELFCLRVAGDTLSWIPEAAIDTVDWAASAVGAAAMEADALARVRRWADFKPASPRPLEELARLRTQGYSGLESAAPAELAAAALEAAGPLREALALRADTVSEEVFRLAVLEAAAERTAQAVSLVEVGTRLHRVADPEAELPSLAANPLLSAGRVDEVRALLVGPQRSFGAPVGPVDQGRTVEVPGAAFLGAQHALAVGSMLGEEAELAPLLADIERTWAGGSYDADERAALRRFVARRLLPVLVGHPSLALVWIEPDPDDPLAAAARSVAAGEPDASALVRTVDREASAALAIPEAFALGRLAAAVGEVEIAVRRLAAVDSMPLPLTAHSSTWGLRTSARLLRAELLANAGDTAGAAEALAALRRLVIGRAGVPASFLNRIDAVAASIEPGR